jgi:hypothetical protein
MPAQIKFTDYVPTSLVGVNSPSPTLAADPVTNARIATGAFPGAVFYLSEKQANDLSAVAVNGASVMQCHAGWYMVVQVDAAATANLIAQGLIGARASLASPSKVTDIVHSIAALGVGQQPVIFLNSVTPGNYTIVQIAGDVNVLASAAVAAVGNILAFSATTGQVAAPTQSGSPTYANLGLIVGPAQNTTSGAGLVRAQAKFPFGVV